MIGDLSRQRITECLQTARYGRSLTLEPVTNSTNADARVAASAGAAVGHVIVADRQLSGRGSRGRHWESPGGLDLYLSIVDRPALSLPQLPPLTLAVGVGVAEAVEQTLGSAAAPRCQVKWPNDVWLGGRKAAGILVEANSQGAQLEAVIVGIGLNVNRGEFSAELAETATSLARVSGQRHDRAQVLCRLLLSVEHWVGRFVTEGPAPVVEALGQRLALRGQPVQCGEVVGLLDGVSEGGALRIRTRAGTREVLTGTLRPVGRAT